MIVDVACHKKADVVVFDIIVCIALHYTIQRLQYEDISDTIRQFFVACFILEMLIAIIIIPHVVVIWCETWLLDLTLSCIRTMTLNLKWY